MKMLLNKLLLDMSCSEMLRNQNEEKHCSPILDEFVLFLVIVKYLSMPGRSSIKDMHFIYTRDKKTVKPIRHSAARRLLQTDDLVFLRMTLQSFYLKWLQCYTYSLLAMVTTSQTNMVDPTNAISQADTLQCHFDFQGKGKRWYHHVNCYALTFMG